MDETTRSTEFVALGHAGSEHYAGIETFPNPGVSHVQMTSDELDGRLPDHRPARLLRRRDRILAGARSASSRSRSSSTSPRFRNEGAFCEALAVKIRDDVAAALELPAEQGDASR